jgi:hypothetical protein
MYTGVLFSYKGMGEGRKKRGWLMDIGVQQGR